jgi:hypothetical protein
MEPVSVIAYVILSLLFGSNLHGLPPDARTQLGALEARQAFIASTQNCSLNPPPPPGPNHRDAIRNPARHGNHPPLCQPP